MRRTLLPALCVLALLSCAGCRDDASSSAAKRERIQRAQRAAKSEAKSEAEPAPPRPAPPEWILVTWDTKLRTAPDRYAPALILAPPPPDIEPSAAPETEPAQAPAQRGRVVRVLGEADEAGQWWRIATGASVDPAATAPAIEGLEFYALDLYVPAGTGEALASAGTEPTPEPTPEANPSVVRTISADPSFGEGSTLMALIGGADSSAAALPVQTGDARTPSLIQEWRVAADAKVYWPNGELAGEVREAHAFVEAGEELELGGRALTCFAARVGPRRKPATRLCFSSEAVLEAAPPPPSASAALGEFGELDDDETARILADLEALQRILQAGDIGVIANDELGAFDELEAFGAGELDEALEADEAVGGTVDAPD